MLNSKRDLTIPSKKFDSVTVLEKQIYKMSNYNQIQNSPSTAVSFAANDIEHILPPARLLT